MTTRDDDDGYDPWEFIDARIDTQRLMAPLNEGERLLIFLHYISGYTISELAGICEVSDRTICRWLERSRNKMRKAAGIVS